MLKQTVGVPLKFTTNIDTPTSYMVKRSEVHKLPTSGSDNLGRDARPLAEFRFNKSVWQKTPASKFMLWPRGQPSTATQNLQTIMPHILCSCTTAASRPHSHNIIHVHFVSFSNRSPLVLSAMTPVQALTLILFKCRTCFICRYFARESCSNQRVAALSGCQGRMTKPLDRLKGHPSIFWPFHMSPLSCSTL